MGPWCPAAQRWMMLCSFMTGRYPLTMYLTLASALRGAGHSQEGSRGGPRNREIQFCTRMLLVPLCIPCPDSTPVPTLTPSRRPATSHCRHIFFFFLHPSSFKPPSCEICPQNVSQLWLFLSTATVLTLVPSHPPQSAPHSRASHLPSRRDLTTVSSRGVIREARQPRHAEAARSFLSLVWLLP